MNLRDDDCYVALKARDVRFDGQFEGPLFQFGDKPYATEGGEFRFAADGSPELAGVPRLISRRDYLAWFSVTSN